MPCQPRCALAASQPHPKELEPRPFHDQGPRADQPAGDWHQASGEKSPIPSQKANQPACPHARAPASPTTFSKLPAGQPIQLMLEEPTTQLRSGCCWRQRGWLAVCESRRAGLRCWLIASPVIAAMLYSAFNSWSGDFAMVQSSTYSSFESQMMSGIIFSAKMFALMGAV